MKNECDEEKQKHAGKAIRWLQIYEQILTIVFQVLYWQWCHIKLYNVVICVPHVYVICVRCTKG